MRTLRAIGLLAAALGGAADAAPRRAAIGCTLNNPAQDLKAVFPDITRYREDARDFPRVSDGKALYEKLRERVGGDLDPVYEAYDTPYTVYSAFKGEELLGHVHGVNVPGRGGVIQVFLSMDPATAQIRMLFFQRLESTAARELRSKEFRGQFAGLGLADFYKHDYYAVAEPGSEKDKVARLKDPTSDAAGKADYQAALRGVRKNLILLDFFVYERRAEPFYERAQESLKRREKNP